MGLWIVSHIAFNRALLACSIPQWPREIKESLGAHDVRVEHNLARTVHKRARKFRIELIWQQSSPSFCRNVWTHPTSEIYSTIVSP